MEFKDENGQILEINNSEQIYKFGYEDLDFLILNFFESNDKKSGVLQQMVDGNVRLYKRYLVEFKPATKAIGYKEAVPNRLVRLDDSYLISIDKSIPESFRNKKSLFEKLKRLKPDIEEYSKKNKLKPKSENDLIQIIKYCNN